MSVSDVELLAILRIGHDMSMGGEGISLRDALARTRYRALRAKIAPAHVLRLVKSNPALVREWLDYSADKRTDGGWYLTAAGEVGTLRGGGRKFRSLEEATAEFVLRELDFWASLRA